jgi:hypothetical protein
MGRAFSTFESFEEKQKLECDVTDAGGAKPSRPVMAIDRVIWNEPCAIVTLFYALILFSFGRLAICGNNCSSVVPLHLDPWEDFSKEDAQ